MSESSTSGRRIRYAVVGLGHIAQVAVLPAFKTAQNSELVALVSNDTQKRSELGKKYGVTKVFSDDEYDQALAEVDAVYLALPNHLHREYAIRAAEAGIHILCEKPMAVTEKDCEAMIEAAERNKVKLMIAYRLHFERGNLEAIRLLESGELGSARIFHSVFTEQVVGDNIRVTEPSARGGGPVYDLGVYCINAARYLFRAEPMEVLAMSASSADERFAEVEEMVSVTMRFPEDRIGVFTCSFGAADVSRYSVVGAKGVLTCDPAYDYALGLKHQIVVGKKTRTRRFPKRDQFAAELVYFSDCVLKNSEPEPCGLEGLADVRVICAIYESLRTGSAVQLAELLIRKRPVPGQEIQRPAHEKPETVNTKSPSGEAA
jgi:glucose-fructose oxidoreductase